MSTALCLLPLPSLQRQILGRFKTLCQERRKVGVSGPPRSDHGVLLQMQLALKVEPVCHGIFLMCSVPRTVCSLGCTTLQIADISHPSKPWECHAEWTRRCMQEFFEQVSVSECFCF